MAVSGTHLRSTKDDEPLAAGLSFNEGGHQSQASIYGSNSINISHNVGTVVVVLEPEKSDKAPVEHCIGCMLFRALWKGITLLSRVTKFFAPFIPLIAAILV